jgi:hypothetical protein
VIRSELTQFDADAYALTHVVEVLVSCYTVEVAPPLSIYSFFSSSPALQVICNPRSIKAHSYALHFHHALTLFFSQHRGVCLVLCWAPRDDNLEGDQLARALTTTACRWSITDLPNSMDHILSVAYQKDHAHRQAFLNWEKDYHLARACNALQVSTTG